MLTKVRQVLRDTSAQRALTDLISDVSVEIATRRDTAETTTTQAELKVLYCLHESLIFAWRNIGSQCSPEMFAFSWDQYLSTLNPLSRVLLRINVARRRQRLLVDLRPALAVAVSVRMIRLDASEEIIQLLEV